MANYHKRNSIRAVQWDPENAQSFEDIKKLIAENPGIGWKADNIVRNDASDNIIIRSFGMIVLRIKPYEYLVEGKKDSLFTVPPETFELMYESDGIRHVRHDERRAFGRDAEYAERPSRLCAGWRPRRYLHHQHQAGIAGKAQAEGSR